MSLLLGFLTVQGSLSACSTEWINTVNNYFLWTNLTPSSRPTHILPVTQWSVFLTQSLASGGEWVTTSWWNVDGRALISEQQWNHLSCTVTAHEATVCLLQTDWSVTLSALWLYCSGPTEQPICSDEVTQWVQYQTFATRCHCGAHKQQRSNRQYIRRSKLHHTDTSPGVSEPIGGREAVPQALPPCPPLDVRDWAWGKGNTI